MTVKQHQLAADLQSNPIDLSHKSLPVTAIIYTRRYHLVLLGLKFNMTN